MEKGRTDRIRKGIEKIPIRHVNICLSLPTLLPMTLHQLILATVAFGFAIVVIIIVDDDSIGISLVFYFISSAAE